MIKNLIIFLSINISLCAERILLYYKNYKVTRVKNLRVSFFVPSFKVVKKYVKYDCPVEIKSVE